MVNFMPKAYPLCGRSIAMLLMVKDQNKTLSADRNAYVCAILWVNSNLGTVTEISRIQAYVIRFTLI